MNTTHFLLALATTLMLSGTVYSQGIEVPEAKPGDIPKVQGRGWLGVGLGTERINKRDYVRVESVFSGSPADSSGFLAGDLILKYRDKTVEGIPGLVKAVGQTAPGSKVIFQVRRAGKTFDVPLLLGLRPDRLELLRSQTLNKPAPAIDLPTLGSKDRVNNKNLKGKIVVLDFWATWCGPCRATIPSLNKLHKKYRSKGVVVIGITDESEAEVKKFMKKTPMKYQIGLDTDGRKANRAFFIQAYPTLMLMDQEGVIREVFIGASSDKIAKLEARIDEFISR